MSRNVKDKKTSIDTAESLADFLRVEGVNVKGFGTIPKAVMKDRRLSIQAKAIYAYFCSYAGAGNRAFPGRDIILKDLQISKDFYYKNLNQLKELDYIRVKRENSKNGKFGKNVYTLVPCPVSQDMAEPLCPVGQDAAILPCPALPDTTAQDINNNRDKKDICLSINPKIDNNWMERMDEYACIVKENIEYEQLIFGVRDKALAESIYLFILDVLCSDEKTFKVNGAIIDAQAVRKRFLDLRYGDIVTLIEGICRLSEPIHNTRNYLLTALYNAKTTSETHWKAAYNTMVRVHRENPARKR